MNFSNAEQNKLKTTFKLGKWDMCSCCDVEKLGESIVNKFAE